MVMADFSSILGEKVNPRGYIGVEGTPERLKVAYPTSSKKPLNSKHQSLNFQTLNLHPKPQTKPSTLNPISTSQAPLKVTYSTNYSNWTLKTFAFSGFFKEQVQ